MREPYHTALARGRQVEAKPVHHWSDARGNLAVRRGLTDGLLLDPFPDVVYADLPWKAGYEEFAARAGYPVPPFAEFMVAAHVEARRYAARGGVCLWVTGASHVKAYLKPDQIIPVTLNKDRAVVAVYGQPRVTLIENEHTTSLLERLATVYSRVLDPCCGYGRAGRIFAQAGKNFTMSDTNAICVGHIAQHAHEWAA